MTTEEVAQRVVELTRQQKAIDTLYDENIVSVEAKGMGGEPAEKRGLQAVSGKADWWVEPPGDSQLQGRRSVCRPRSRSWWFNFDIDVTEKNLKNQMQMAEVRSTFHRERGKMVRE